MNAILIYKFSEVVINGSLVDAFEYYIQMLEYNKDIKLILINHKWIDISYLFDIFEEKYYLDDLNWKENIELIQPKDLIRMKFDNVLLLDYGTIPHVKGIINSKRIHYITELNKESAFLSAKNVIYYGEMPFVWTDVKYTIKLLFNRMRKFSYSDDKIYLNNPVFISTIGKIIPKSDEYYLNSDIKHLLDKPFFCKKSDHTKNLFESFNKYIYYHTNEYFDPHPRLMHECLFHEKEIHYVNKFDVRDGSYYRYYDMLDRGYKHRVLSKNDEIVREFI